MRAFLTVLFLALAATAHGQELRALDISDSGAGTRVVFNLDAAAAHEWQTLTDPDRVVIDLQGVKRGSNVGAWIEGKGLVQRIRTGPQKGKLRIVLDLAQAVPAKISDAPANADHGYQVIVDLGSASPVAETESTAPVATVEPEATPEPQPAPASNSVVVASAEPAKKVAAEPAPARKPHGKRTVIAIDAGHGGEDPGARGKHGLEEKDVALSMARKLARLIDAEPGYKAVLIRDGDYFIPLRGRINKARKAQADLFVSIHCNASPSRDAKGSAVYALSPRGATNEHARWLANKENAADLIGGIDLQDKDDTLAAVLFDISQTSAMEASIDVGGRVLGSLSSVNNLLRTDVQQAGFAVLKSPDIPSILVETAFISNPEEERQLKDSDYQQQMAASILAGIKGYFESYRPATVVASDGAHHAETGSSIGGTE